MHPFCIDETVTRLLSPYCVPRVPLTFDLLYHLSYKFQTSFQMLLHFRGGNPAAWEAELVYET